MFKLLRPEDFTPEIIDQIIDLGRKGGTWVDSDTKYYKEQFQNPSNINIIYRNSDSEPISGYILAKPHNEAVQDYLIEDPLMCISSEKMFYVDYLGVDEGVSGKSLGIRLIHAMVKEANLRGASKFSMHCRVENKLSRVVQRKFDIYYVRRIEKYVDCKGEEPFDYIEGFCVA